MRMKVAAVSLLFIILSVIHKVFCFTKVSLVRSTNLRSLNRSNRPFSHLLPMTASSNHQQQQDDGNKPSRPRLIIFDLDGCLWRPEMYELQWEGRGAGSPFELVTPSTARSNSGTIVELLGNVPNVLEELYSDPQWSHTQVGISSRTDEPSWAKELLSTFTLPLSNVPISSAFDGPREISYDSKTKHFERISASTGIPMEDMLFFDNEYGNCRSVSKQGVSVCYCPDGVTKEAWERALQSFPCPKGKVVGMDI